VPHPLAILQTVFGFPGFRGRQLDVIERVMAGVNTLAVMPTGAGKSLCYQVPALALPGTCIVVSPLIALMHDQLRAAEAVGIRAATLTSVDTNRAETIERYTSGALDLLYVAPERASGSGFRELLDRAPVALFAIDEAHCVSEWGHDFRPDYRLLRPLLDRFGHVPRLALTATADAHTRADILAQLGIPHDGLILAGFDRPNIRYAMSPRSGTTKQVADLVAATPGPGIVYVQSRAGTDKLADALSATGRPGLDPAVRAANQSAFVASEDMVMCATIAFGMGIDKPDVRFVAHAGLPKSIEAYYQETGRAGRDGDPAVAHLFWGADDFARARQRLGEVAEDRIAGERVRLAALVLLRHFGESPPETCGNCDNCLNPPARTDLALLAQKLLSAVYRTGQIFGVQHIEAVLTGLATDRVVKAGHDRLSVFGIAQGAEAALIKPVARALLLRDALGQTEHGGLALGPAARAILKGEAGFEIAVPPKALRQRRREQTATNPVGDPLFDALRACRRDLAAQSAVPPYVIFHDSTLREIAAARPATLNDLGRLAGVGARKLDAYGDAFLAVVRQY
jgi:ATP-dependent DNA helicase RecQ